MIKAEAMGYLEEFKLVVYEGNVGQFVKIWEEYCLADEVDGHELAQVLKIIKDSSLAHSFGPFTETALALWKKIEEQESADKVLALILDLQTTNSPLYAELALDLLQRRYGSHPHYKEMLRIVGLRQKQNFQGAISHFELLAHLGKGKFVFHTGGWGVGEIIDFSMLREHISVEFEGISAVKDISFSSAFSNLIPLPSDHFLARRFGNPDLLEKEGKEDPLMLVTLLLRDLGPKTAADIKNELCELVIPEDEWNKWWQNTRIKLKKDTHIQSPKSSKEPFELRKKAFSHDQQLLQGIEKVKNIEELILLIYNFTRDFPDVFKNNDVQETIKKHLEGKLLPSFQTSTALDKARQVQLYILLEDLYPEEYEGQVKKTLLALDSIEEVLKHVDIIAFKKRILTTVRKCYANWQQLFMNMLFTLNQNQLRDYIFKELLQNEESKKPLIEKLQELLHKMTLFPEAFFWYFQKIASKEDVPLSSADSRRSFLEAFCILLHYVENREELKELTKKMYQLLCANRYLIVREMIEGSSIEYLREFLLLASKCYCFSKQDIRTLQSLCEVVQPSLKNQKEEVIEEIIWTTAEGYRKTQEKIQHLGTVEMIDNAREIEEARAHGDLRENSEYKFALERRSRLQGELAMLSKQLNIARILTPADISPDHICPGSIVVLTNNKGEKITYTLLGPWDANSEKNILSFQSKFAERMLGLKVGDEFEFQDAKYKVDKIKSYIL